MTESEAIFEIMEHKPIIVFSKYVEALNMAINALDKQEKIKEVFTHYAFSGNDMNIMNDCIRCFLYIKNIMEGGKMSDLHSMSANAWNEGFEEGMRKGYSKAENDYHAQSEKDRQSAYDCGYDAGYYKAIDDFSETVRIAVTEMDDIGAYDNPTKRVCEILEIEAEQLKERESE